MSEPTTCPECESDHCVLAHDDGNGLYWRCRMCGYHWYEDEDEDD